MLPYTLANLKMALLRFFTSRKNGADRAMPVRCVSAAPAPARASPLAVAAVNSVVRNELTITQGVIR